MASAPPSRGKGEAFIEPIILQVAPAFAFHDPQTRQAASEIKGSTLVCCVHTHTQTHTYMYTYIRIHHQHHRHHLHHHHRTLYTRYIDRILTMQNWTGIVLEGLSSADTVVIGQIGTPLMINGSSSAVVLVRNNEGSTTTVTGPPASSTETSGTSEGVAVVVPAGFIGELTKMCSNDAFDVVVEDSLSYVVGDLYSESTWQSALITGAGTKHTGPTGNHTIRNLMSTAVLSPIITSVNCQLPCPPPPPPIPTPFNMASPRIVDH